MGLAIEDQQCDPTGAREEKALEGMEHLVSLLARHHHGPYRGRLRTR